MPSFSSRTFSFAQNKLSWHVKGLKPAPMKKPKKKKKDRIEEMDKKDMTRFFTIVSVITLIVILLLYFWATR